MKTEITISKKTNLFRNIALAVLAAVALGAGFVAFDQYSQSRDLKMQLGVHELSATQIVEAFGQIESNLAEIRKREGYISSTLNLDDMEAPLSPQDRIFNEISVIDELLAENRILIDTLSSQLGMKDDQISKYSKSVGALEGRVSDYKVRLNELTAKADALNKDLGLAKLENANINEKLTGKEQEIDDKNRMINDQITEIQHKDQALRTAYFVVGSFKELRDQKVVDKEGGIIGIAATKTLKADFNRNRFTKLDIFEKTTIPVYGRDVEIVTNHPSGSYELVRESDGMVKWIKITAPQRFWESSKYLVILTKEDSSDLASAPENL